MKKHILLLLALLVGATAYAARERNYIFLFDCTKSMVGYNGAPNVMSQTQDFLRQNIASLPDETMVHIVLFQKDVCKTFSCQKQDYDHQAVVKEIDNLAQNVTNTNICSAWQKGVSFINPAKENYIVLITDGEDNVQGIGALSQLLRDFCGKFANTHAFYVTLTKNAMRTNDPKTAELIESINLCDDIELVDVSAKIQMFGDLANDCIRVSTLALPQRATFLFSAMGEYKATARNADPHIDVQVEKNRIKGGYLNIIIASKYGKDINQLNAALNSDEYEFEVEVVPDPSENIQIVNPRIRIIVDNRAERMLTLEGFLEDDVLQEEIEAATDTWYDSFLFWGADEHERITVDLKPVFNRFAVEDRSEARLSVIVYDEDGKVATKCRLFVNGEEMDGEVLTIKAGDDKAELALEFDDDCPTGKHYIRLHNAGSRDLECINQMVPEEMDLSIRTAYHTVLNPLLIALLAILCIIVTALVIWFLFAKPSLYPTIKVGYLTIFDPYHRSRRIKGARMVVCTARRQSQSFLNRLFTGTIIYEVNEVWQHPLEITAKRKALRMKLGREYLADDSTLRPNEDAVTIEDVETRTKISLSCN